MSCVYAKLFAVTLLSAGGSVSHENCLLQRTSGTTQEHIGMDGETCSPLKNQGSFFSVPLCVGTPAQCFDVVADTGSDAVIVPDCICGETPGAGCTPTDKCFRGTNTSSTFSLPAKTKIVSMTFGSGTIQAAVAKDVVSVGDFKVTMEDGVLLIVNRAQLEIPGAFEGILGLGIPKDKAVMASLIQGLVHAANHAPGDQDVFDDQLRTICSLMPTLCDHYLPLPHHPSPAQHGGGDRVSDPYETKLFLQQAKVDRFSMCFRDGAQTGALRLGRLPTSSPLQNIGKLHWGLNFQGLSVGAHTAPAPAETIFCGPETMKEGMETPCAIIPDSGTTLLTGPAEQVSALEAGICSKWERCQTSSGGIPSSVAFRKLLFACGQWLTKENGLLEIPSMFFHVKSGPGMPEAFELTAWAWVTETTMRLSDGSAEKVCQSSIGSLKQDYITQKNGPVWIFGHPLFYEYNIGYDLSTKQISLQRGQCEPCSTGAGPVSLNDEGGRRWPRASHGEPRVPHYDVNLPL